MSTFDSLGLSAPVLKALADEGYITPTPIQAQAIKPVLEGRDLLGCAQTGTGKTAAFALPILSRLMALPADKSRRGHHPRVLVLSPTRELAVQIAESFSTYGRHTGITNTTVFGGVSQHHQVRALQRGVDVLIATPGRLIDLMQQRIVNLTQVSVLILDEADRMLDMGFIEPIRRIVSALPAPRQTLMFSATMPKPIMRLADSLLREPVKVSVTPIASTVPLIEQQVYMVPRHSKQALLEHLVTEQKISRAIVFTRTKHGADKVFKRLVSAGITAEAIHGNKAQNQRQRALLAFRTGRSRVLVATDVAARGLDVDGISHVFNFDVPHEPESYVHRIGRTGRAGAAGIAISFCDGQERDLIRDIEKLTGKPIAAITKLPPLPEPKPYLEPHRDHGPRREPQHRNAHRSGGRPQSPHAHPRAKAAQHGGHAANRAQSQPTGAGAGAAHAHRSARPAGPAPTGAGQHKQAAHRRWSTSRKPHRGIGR